MTQFLEACNTQCGGNFIRVCVQCYCIGYTQNNGEVSKVNKKFYILQLDGAPPPFSHKYTGASQSRSSTALWIGRAAKGDNHLLPLPPCSPDLTPCDFFLWAFVKDGVYVPPLPMSLKELRDRITHALQTVTADMLHRGWDEFDYRVDVCRVTQGAHIEGL